MNFLYPGFLFALLSVAIPVIVHLFNFRKFKKVYFSNVQFLKVIEQQNSSREKLKNLLILLSRVLAIIFLVLAFAQPYIPLSNQKSALTNNTVSIYIDNSYSMEAVNEDGNLLDEAKRRAGALVNDFGLNDRFQLLTNDFEGRHQRLLNRDEFLKALEGIKISAASRNLQQIFNRQENVLTGQANKYIFLISDFQKNIATKKKPETRPDIQYAFLKLNAATLPNVAIDSVWSLSPNHQPGANEQLVVQLKNYSEQDAINIPLKLTINNRQKALSSVTIPAGKIKTDTLNFSGLSAGWQKGLLNIKDFPVTFDDSLYFSFKVDANFPVLNISGTNSGNYIRALFAADNYYQVTENSESNINYGSFSRYGLIVLNGLKNPSSGLAQQLRKYLKSGGTIALFPDLDGDMPSYNAFLSSLSLPVIKNLDTMATRVDKIDLQNPLFRSVFEDIPKNLDLPAVKRYLNFTESNSANKENIMSLPGGKTFFSKFGIEHGFVYLSATGLDLHNGNFATHPVFVPLLYRLTLNSGGESNLYHAIGSETTLSTKYITLGKNQVLKLRSKNFEVIPEIRKIEGKTLIYVADQVKSPGFYNLNLADSILAVYSFNNSRIESDMHYLSKNELDNLADHNNLKIYDTDKNAVKFVSGTNKIGQTLWKLCLILSLIFIAAEILLIRFFNNKKRTI